MTNNKNYVTMDGNTAAAYASYAFTEVARYLSDYTFIGHGRQC